MRATISPAFTGSKMRAMFQFVRKASQDYAEILRAEAASSERPYEVDVRDVSMRYSADVIGSTAFGLELTAMREHDDRINGLGNEMMQVNDLKNRLLVGMGSVWPSLFEWLGCGLFTREQKQFYHDMVHGTIRNRQQTGLWRPDVIQLLMEAKASYEKHEQRRLLASAMAVNGDGAAYDDDGSGEYVDRAEAGCEDMRGFQKRYWDDDDVTAQFFIFFFAGCETMATLMGFAVQELMEHWPIQQRLIEEIDAVRLGLNGRAVEYDDLNRCQFLDMVVSGELFRSCRFSCCLA